MVSTRRSKVAVAICGSYDNEKVYRAVSGAIAALGGIESFVSPSERILVKPNLLYPSESERSITTHPAVISAVLRLLSEAGCGSVAVGDSPANGNCVGAMHKLGLTEDKLFGAHIADMSHEVSVDYPEGKTAKHFYFTREVTESDAIIGVCKMKTHMLERVTGALKNMYGLVCGFRKAVGHTTYNNAAVFARMLCDLYKATPQRLHVMDGVVAMEGNGPASGDPVQMGVILASSDPIALDSVFCRLVYLSPKLVPTNVYGALAGIGTFEESEIDVVLIDEDGSEKPVAMSELVERCGDPDFDVLREGERLNVLTLLARITGGKRKPVIDASLCARCGVCVDHCPVEGKALSFAAGRNEPPVYNYKKCIRCYCCQEVCPKKAISVK